ncbi:MAG TPA: VOC family protein [Candidatus Limnocylindria bacterium]|nr:VOC family protein [Candidatus Limnocylindria bacterium]
MAARLAASDIGRARAWYEEKLGLVPEKDEMGGVSLWYRTADTWFLLYQTDAAGTARNTVGGWEVENLDAVMAELRKRGVTFEDYDFGEMKTVDGVLSMGGYRAAWFRDSEGNILELTESPS